VGGYRRHVELTDEELERLEAVMYLRPLCLGCFSYRRELVNGRQPGQEVSGFANPEHNTDSCTGRDESDHTGV
jgi:hypothetical protein